jgi:peptidoglycan hydrolase-like protein with peptidoglycan-binding domain
MLDAGMRFAGVGRACNAQTCYWALDLGSQKTNVPAPGNAQTPNPAPALSWPLVRQGDSGARVEILQGLLRERGQDIVVDGDFGAQTDAAVRVFQGSRGLTVDGIVGPNTWQALIVTVRAGSRGEAVSALQKALNARGSTLAVDGIFGPLTQGAVRNYQQTRGLGVDGIVGPQTWNALINGR